MTEGKQLKVLDLFCGMGGWSIGFHREGFRCYGLDEIDVGYPYEFWHSPIEEFRGGEYREMGFDVVVASPPCTEFSHITDLSFHKGQRGPRDPEKGMRLVREAKRAIELVDPKFWMLENVQGSRKYIEPLLGKPILDAKPWLLWGNLNGWMFPQEPKKHSKQFHQLNDWTRGKGGDRRGLPQDFPFDPLRSWKRARIPVWLSQTIAKSCKDALEREHTNPKKVEE